ncbi:WhiB family transcriptional regulator [Klebsiella pneumoniae]|nr:WhiB family transcriptional regulator [Klebsiella pneumoniae]
MTPDNTGRQVDGVVYCRACRSGGAGHVRVRARAAVSWEWQDDAACRGMDLVLFFGPEGELQPKREAREAKAKAICGGCLVRAQCLDYAITQPEKYGTWGGLNEEERVAVRRSRRQGAAA